MYKVTLFTTAFAVLFASAFAAPNPQAEIVYHCANEANDTCPSAEYTCCGPILPTVGGTCRILKEGEVCIF